MSDMDFGHVPLVKVSRGDAVESVHYGAIAVVNSGGGLLARAGSPEASTFLRSAAKPFQVLPILTSGAADHFRLTRKELAVMKLLVERPHEVVSRRELLSEVWELPNHPNTRVVDNVIVSLRRAFESDATKPRHILSARGVGYRFVP